MLHLLWYIIVGLIAGFIANSVMHLHMTLLWTIVLGLVSSILGGFITHLFDRPKPEANYHPAGIIVSILFALLVLWLLSKVPHILGGSNLITRPPCPAVESAVGGRQSDSTFRDLSRSPLATLE